jgi:hypothetical protein
MANGTGGLDWSGLPLAMGFLGIEDVEGLMNDLMVIKGYIPPKEAAE